MRKLPEYQSCVKTRNKFEKNLALQLFPNENLACTAAVTHTSTGKFPKKTFSWSQITSGLQAVKTYRRWTTLCAKNLEEANMIKLVLQEMEKIPAHQKS